MCLHWQIRNLYLLAYPLTHTLTGTVFVEYLKKKKKKKKKKKSYTTQQIVTLS